MINKEKLFTRKSAPEQTARMVETIIGCKWSITVYQLLKNEINRPGEMLRTVEGLTTKVLNSCLKKNIDFGILNKVAYAETPPRVEYQITQFGKKFIAIIDQLELLQAEIETLHLE